ncbi:hypothetical protein [Enterococcus faecium]|uniref:hypothetical protein n=1 Tax=Enterococcus faecium TaxID=1352 RepID=UPI00032DF7D0|nr:hypothetical protein [Enterococcus faecium]EOM14372.1 hypothetical protein U9W_00331 [Enterococcus faecium EnGen0261]
MNGGAILGCILVERFYYPGIGNPLIESQTGYPISDTSTYQHDHLVRVAEALAIEVNPRTIGGDLGNNSQYSEKELAYNGKSISDPPLKISDETKKFGGGVLRQQSKKIEAECPSLEILGG